PRRLGDLGVQQRLARLLESCRRSRRLGWWLAPEPSRATIGGPEPVEKERQKLRGRIQEPPQRHLDGLADEHPRRRNRKDPAGRPNGARLAVRRAPRPAAQPVAGAGNRRALG